MRTETIKAIFRKIPGLWRFSIIRLIAVKIKEKQGVKQVFGTIRQNEAISITVVKFLTVYLN